jgi:hypothetical protein
MGGLARLETTTSWHYWPKKKKKTKRTNCHQYLQAKGKKNKKNHRKDENSCSSRWENTRSIDKSEKSTRSEQNTMWGEKAKRQVAKNVRQTER